MPSAQRKSGPPAQEKTVEVIDPRWLLRMLGVMLLLALVCGYLTMGLLFYLGSWQLVLHPTRNAKTALGVSSQHVDFAPDGTGKPQLSGEWVAADADKVSPRNAYAVLFLRAGDGQLDAGDGTQMAMLANLGLNVFAFDYRGFGSSAERPHPSEDRMLADAVSAWQYLTGVRHVAPDHVLVFGSGVGVSLGTQLLQQYGPGAGLIAYNADPAVEVRVRQDGRSHLFPMRLVFHDRFSLYGLQHLGTPKLLYTVGTLDPAREAVYRTAADPKLTVEVPSHDASTERAAMSRFLDLYLAGAPIPVLTPQLPLSK